jgi:hypothetical protein
MIIGKVIKYATTGFGGFDCHTDFQISAFIAFTAVPSAAPPQSSFSARGSLWRPMEACEGEDFIFWRTPLINFTTDQWE